MNDVRRIHPDERLVKREPKILTRWTFVRQSFSDNRCYARILSEDPVQEGDRLHMPFNNVTMIVDTCTATGTSMVYDVTLRNPATKAY